MRHGRMVRLLPLALILVAAAGTARAQQGPRRAPEGAPQAEHSRPRRGDWAGDLPLGAEQPPIDGMPSDDGVAPAPEDLPAEEGAEVDEVPVEALPPGFAGVAGTIVDAETGSPLADVRVEVVSGGSGEARTDRAGRYRLKLPPGRYQLRIYYPLYQIRRIRNVVVAERPRIIDVKLPAADDAVEEIVVEAEPERRSEAGLLQIRKRAAAVSDSLSAQEMSRSPDSAASDAARRVVSVTVEDGSYVLIRGLGDRYVTTLLNGAPLPSTEPDRQAVPLDLFPTSLLANLRINKSYSAEHPASFAGGTMLIESNDYPDDLTVKLKVGTSGDTESTGSDQATYAGGGLDFFGFDDGTRSLPDAVPDDRPALADRSTGLDASAMENIGEAFDNRWTSETRTVYPNLSLGATVGDSVDAGGGEVGYIGTLSFSHKMTAREATRAKISDAGGDQFEMREPTRPIKGVEAASIGALAAAGWKPAADHQVDLFGMYVHTGEDTAELLTGRVSNLGEVEGTRLIFLERSMGFAQIASRHRFRRASNLELRWQGNASMVGRDEPDTRSLRYQVQGEGLMRYVDALGSGERFYSELSETGVGTGLDASLPLGRLTLSLGGSVQQAERTFSARRFRFVFVGDTADPLFLPPDRIFDADQIGPNFELQEVTAQTDAYEGSQVIAAGYSAAGLELTRRLRLHGGVRYETATQELTSGSPHALGQPDADDQVDRTDRAWAPSSSAVLALTDEMNLRAAYSYTVARPRFREVAPFLFTDYTRDLNISGNPDLVESRIHNADVRWEWFAGDTDLFAASLFYKQFRDPIETKLVPTGDISFANAEGARAIGAELEARFSLGLVHPALREARLWTNATLSRTRIELREEDIGSQTSSARALQGQAPVVFNFGASWSHQASGTEVTALYNVVGRRIEEVGNNDLPHTYRQPVHQVDLAASQKLGGDLSLKLGASNLLDQAEVLRQAGFEVYRQSAGVAVSAALEWAP
jgi:outer membrane receptor protein involved in Fe transport